MRYLRELESVADEEIPPPPWTVRQGLVFLGAAIVIIAILAGGATAILRPPKANRNSFMLEIDKDAIQREVNKLSPAQAYARLEPVIFSLPDYVEQLSQSAVPAHLLPCVKLLAAVEGNGPQALAPQATQELAKQAGKRAAEITAQVQTRRAMNDWLWLIAVAAVLGILLAGAALIFPQRQPRRRTAAASKR